MSVSFTVLGGDARQRFLAQQLRNGGFHVRTFRVPELRDSAPDLPACVRGADVLLLPMPAFSSPDAVRAASGALPLAQILDAAAAGALVCGGVLAPAQAVIHHRGLRTFDYALDEALALENAELTAEGALARLLTQLPRPLSGSRVLVCGFGRIGKLLARKLSVLGAMVTVSARSAQDLALAALLGYACERTGAWHEGLTQYDAIVNTVPAEIITPAQLAAIREPCVLLELASLPGGFCPQAKVRPAYLAARGLPGAYAPEQAAAIIRRAVLRHLSLEETV